MRAKLHTWNLEGAGICGTGGVRIWGVVSVCVGILRGDRESVAAWFRSAQSRQGGSLLIGVALQAQISHHLILQIIIDASVVWGARCWRGWHWRNRWRDRRDDRGRSGCSGRRCRRGGWRHWHGFGSSNCYRYRCRCGWERRIHVHRRGRRGWQINRVGLCDRLRVVNRGHAVEFGLVTDSWRS